MKCLENIVGVMETECACVDGELGSEMKAKLKLSKSGLYLDSLPGGITLKALQEVDVCKNLGEIALACLAAAAKTLSEDLIIGITARYDKAAPNFNGMIGQMSYGGSLPVNRPFQGMVLRSNKNSDAIMTVSRIMLVVNMAATLDLKVIKAYSGSAVGVEVKSIPVTTTANNYTILDVPPFDLPLSENGKALDYYFVYDTTATPGLLAKDNKIDCNCSAGHTDSLNNYIKPIGVEITGLGNLMDMQADKFTHGVLIDVSIKCSNEQLVCREYDANEAVAVTMARAVWYKAGELMIEEVKKSPEINRYTTMSSEYLWGKRNHFRTQYEDRVTYLASAVNVDDSGCYICKGQETMFVSTILATDDENALLNDERDARRIHNEATGDGFVNVSGSVRFPGRNNF